MRGTKAIDKHEQKEADVVSIQVPGRGGGGHFGGGGHHAGVRVLNQGELE